MSVDKRLLKLTGTWNTSSGKMMCTYFFLWAVFIVFIPKYVSIRSAKSCNADNFTSLIGVLCKVAEKIEWFVVTVLDKNN